MNAEEILKSHVKDIDIIEHSRRVLNICNQFIDSEKDLGKFIDIDILRDSAILHDIAKCDENKDKKNHNKIVRDIIENNKEWSEALPNREEIYEIIKAHKGKFKPDEEIAIEAAILRLADKLDKFKKNKNRNKASEKCKDSMEKIEEYFESASDSNSTAIKLIKKAYNKLYNAYNKEFIE